MLISVGNEQINMRNVERVVIVSENGLQFDMVSGVSVAVSVKDASASFREIRWAVANGLRMLVLEVEK